MSGPGSAVRSESSTRAPLRGKARRGLTAALILEVCPQLVRLK